MQAREGLHFIAPFLRNVSESSTASTPAAEPRSPHRESYGRLFGRFLRFGANAWGGPVAQIDMIRQELVTRERWVTPEHFRRLLAVYQVLPGPEAHELCVHFGIIARGRMGGILAGLGFMLPGLALMLALSWFYLQSGLGMGIVHAAFLGMQPAVVALIVRASHRIGQHCLVDLPLWVIALLAAVAEACGSSFWITLIFGGVAYIFGAAKRWIIFAVLTALFIAVATYPPIASGKLPWRTEAASVGTTIAAQDSAPAPSTAELLGSGLRAGLLTFGGAYTAIPFLKEDAVERGRWMTERDFLDGVALAGVIPAPLIIFSTFVGYFGGGLTGALVMTLGVFLPAFAFPLLLYHHLEAFIRNVALRHFLEGVTAGVVGIIVVTALRLAFTAITDLWAAAIAVGSLVVLYLWKSRIAVPLLMLAAAVAGALLYGSSGPSR